MRDVKRRNGNVVARGRARRFKNESNNEIKIAKWATGDMNASRQLDEFEYAGDVIQPPFEPEDLIALVERNDSIKQNIEALAMSACGFDHGIKYQDDFELDKAEGDIKKQAEAEWDLLKRLYKSINGLNDLKDVLKKMVVDRHTIGWGTIEVLRNVLGDVSSIEYCRACNVRIAKSDNAPIVIAIWEETDKGYEKVANYIKFKKFVQIVNGKKRYFKEFGNPRIMNFDTGEYDEDTPEALRATEIAYFPIHSCYTDYGVPHWINVSTLAAGSVMADILNFVYFDEGKILPAAIVVNGGGLTKESIKRIQEGTGVDNAYKLLLLEALPDSKPTGIATPNAQRVSIDIKPLTDTTNRDSLFRGYKEDNKSSVREAFRLPPIYTGSSADYNRATAETATNTAEEQVILPERKAICSVFNKVINNELGIRYCELYLKAPLRSNADEKIKMLRLLLDAGALVPNNLVDIVSETINKDIDSWDDDLGKIPFSLLLAKSANSNSKSTPDTTELTDDSIAEEKNITKEDYDEQDAVLNAVYELSRSVKKAVNGR